MRGPARHIAAAALGLFCLLGLFQMNPAVGFAERVNRDVAIACTGVYVSLRAINAALSIAQEVELGGSLGVSATAQPLKVLEPVDDTIERVAGVVFAVAVLSALLSVALGPVSMVGAVVALGGLAVLTLAPRRVPVMPGARAAVRLGAVLVLVVPLVLGVGATLGELLTRPAWEQANTTLSEVADRAGVLIGGDEAASLPADPAPESPGGLMDRLGDMVAGTGETVGSAMQITRDYAGAASYFLSEADALFESALVILAVFLLRTLALPLVLFWVAWRMILSAVSRAPGRLPARSRS